MKRLIFLLVCGLVGDVVGFEQPERQSVQFWSQLYPLSPLRNVHALSMRLWGIVDQAARAESDRTLFLDNHALFTQELVHLHSIVIVLLASLETQESQEFITHAVQDFQHIYNVVVSMSDSYENLLNDYDDDYVPVTRYMLSALCKRLELTLSSGSVTLPVYALLRSPSLDLYPKQATPLFPPANIVPVAPIA